MDNLLCYDCKEDYPLIEDPVCKKCGKQLAHDDDCCLDCKNTEHLYEKGIALYPYEGTIKEALYRFKYGGRRKYAQFFAKNMYTKLKETTFIHEVDLIIPVPVSKERLKQRGYNQAEEIAKYLSKISRIPYNKDILIRNKDTKPQSGFSPSQRAKNIKDAFKCTGQLMNKYKVILVIDDIYTTGSTIDECSKILKNSGAGKVYNCVVCIGSLGSQTI
ncbi:MAG TPA: ComF family protein [Epulopiscium sp.]|nr:ComF family protein [Candidatus Epulonipiscium sp.]